MNIYWLAELVRVSVYVAVPPDGASSSWWPRGFGDGRPEGTPQVPERRKSWVPGQRPA